MKDDNSEPSDVKVSEIVRAARTKAELPPGFQAAVWCRIEKADVPSVSVLERLAQWFLTPRLATALAAAVLLLAAGTGAIRGFEKGEREARDRYLASVDPSYLQH